MQRVMHGGSAALVRLLRCPVLMLVPRILVGTPFRLPVHLSDHGIVGAKWSIVVGTMSLFASTCIFALAIVNLLSERSGMLPTLLHKLPQLHSKKVVFTPQHVHR